MSCFRSLVFLFSTLSVILKVYAQPAIEWETTLGGSAEEIAYDVEQCPDGGYLVVGSAWSEDGDISAPFAWLDFWVVKLTAAGELDWEASYGGSNHEIARDALPTQDGGYIVVGQTSSEDGQVSENQGGSDYWILKLDATGQLEWEKSYGGAGSDYGYAIEQAADGGYFIAGGSQSSNGDVSENKGGVDYWIIRLSASGELIWERSYGGSRDDLAFALDKTDDGGCIVTGRTRSSNGDVTGFHGGVNFSFDAWVVKLSSQGDLEWEHALGGTDFDESYTIRQTTEGGYILAGLTRSNDGDITENPLQSDLWVVKLDEAGEITWQDFYGSYNKDIAGEIQQTADGGYIITGCTGPAGDKLFWALKLTSEGVLDWEKSYGGTEDDRAFSIKQTIDSGYIMAGRTASNNGDVGGNNGDYDYWVVKLGACAVNTEVQVLENGLQSSEVALSSTYQWIDCATGTLVEGAQEAFLSPPVWGEYAVIVTHGSCVDTSACVNYCPLPDNLLLIGDTMLLVSEEVAHLPIQWLDCNTDSIIEGATGPNYTPVINSSFAALVTSETCSATTECVYVCPEEIELEISISNDTLFILTDTAAVTKYQLADCSTGGSFAISFRPYFILDESGEYGVRVTQGQCTSELTCLTYCTINNQINVDGDVLQAAADPEISTFQWINCTDGSLIPGETAATFTATSSGDYAVIITQGPCVDTSECVNRCLIDTELSIISGGLQANNDSTNTAYQWIDCISGLVIPGAEDFQFFPEMSGQYAVIITQESCVDTSACATFCAIDIALSVQGNTIYSQADSTISSYLWYNCSTGGVLPNEQGPSFTPSTDGNYGVLITQGPCSGSSVCVDFTLVGTEELENQQLSVFPNPVQDLLVLESGIPLTGADYTIYDAHGSLVSSGTVNLNRTVIQVDFLPAGGYVIKVETEEGQLVHRFVKQD
ncbi:MAG: T9SS type A sorting domain-containing protein [Bacteroidota bacterium]